MLIKYWLSKELPDYEWINPFDSPLTEQWMDRPNAEIARKIVKKDLDLIKHADIVIAYLPDVPHLHSIGVPMEIFYARYCLGKPVYVVTPWYHPWLLALECNCFATFDDLVRFLRGEEDASYK